MTFRDRYGRLDRGLHRIAFRAGIAQLAMADLERTLFRDALDGVAFEDPVFLSGLPRSGTTILLELLAGTGVFATHTYRDAPFVLCPLLWARFSKRFAVDGEPRERAHGDGLTIHADSPEAFEEAVWKRFWPDHYRDDRIVPWARGTRNAEFDDWFADHARSVVALRAGDDPTGPTRYLSKNNVQIARLGAGLPALDRGVFVVPFREPVQHAASLLRQHRRFARLQAEDGFLLEYMEGVGHHDFGLGLRPVDFGGWLEGAPSPETLEFWLRYWAATYGHVLDRADGSTVLLSYDGLVASPGPVLGRLAERVGVPAAALEAGADRIRPPRDHPVASNDAPRPVVEAARAIHRRLLGAASA